MKPSSITSNPHSHSSSPQPRIRRWKRILLITIALPLVAAALMSLTTAYRIYASNRAMAQEHLPIVRMPKAPQRLLVFSPHPDDETLGAAGLMREARLHGCDVKVVFLTCGDAFHVGAERTLHVVDVTPQDYVRYGELRQGESRAALAVLGIPGNHVVFLGYPDQGMMPLWTTHWNQPYTSPYTQVDHTPYPDAANPHAIYTGASVLASIKHQMMLDHPTDIYITHPSDDHPDHAAGSVFVRTALLQLRAEGVPWALKAHLHYFLVHRGDWPVPEGLHENASLPPPAQMAYLDTQWKEFPLTPYDVKRKYAAIKRYQSQMQMMSRFLLSFARRNELFGKLSDDKGALPVVPDGRIHIDGSRGDWTGISPLDMNPSGDTLMRTFEPSANISRVWACRDSHNLYVRLDANASLSTRVRYAITLRPVQPGTEQPESLYLTLYPHSPLRPHPITHLPGGRYAWRGSLLEVAIPLREAGLGHLVPGEFLYISAETRLADIGVDKTGFRGLKCGPVQSAR